MNSRGAGAALVVAVVSVVGCYASHERRADAASSPDVGTLLGGCLASDGVASSCPPDTTYRHYSVRRGRSVIDGEVREVCVCAPVGCLPTVAWACDAYRPGVDPEGLECAYTVPRDDSGGYCLHPCAADADCPALTRCLDVSEVMGHPYDMPRACFAVLAD